MDHTSPTAKQNQETTNKTNATSKAKAATTKLTRDTRRGKNKKDPNEIIKYPHFGNKVLNWKLEDQDLDNTKFLKLNIIGVLFTGSWVPPANEFMVSLTNLYKEVNETEKVFEIVQISNERTEKEYKEAITEDRPWLYLPYNDVQIQKMLLDFKIAYLPTFFVVNRDFFILSDNGRKDMLDYPGTKAYERWYKAYRARKESLDNKEEENIPE